MTPTPAIFYAACKIKTPDISARVARAGQSVAVRRLMEELTQAAGLASATDLVGSQSHCRGLVAAVCGVGAELRIGVDVEFDSPGRPIADIAALYLGEAVAGLTPRAFYRAWTVGEAWIKAFGARPDSALIRRVLADEVADGRVYRLGAAEVLHDTPAPGFRLSLVWNSAGGDAAPVRLGV